MKLFRGRSRIIVLAMLALVLGAAVYGFAAANTVPANNAGEGDGVISGYTVTNIDYTLDASDPTAFSQVAFDLTLAGGGNAPATTEVHVGVGDGATTYWTTCTAGTLPNWTCNLSSSTVGVRAAIELHVAAAQ
ncbi:MAG: hypothetical protein B6I38_05130 [Anaerolineaceae bacterium 4572_5.1]|nr:MAG: hypothetical protein B5M51_07135 [Anaerolinea sp. 4484_236]OQY31999.1 MAG: hypothetical protein B6I38_05130 [Anaerolineaceae bacterium 4572_5.1]RLD10540.1 MAG: hypothetical protein DRI56_02520 [Chloroflexota bacterium]